jgi:HTH-type transcriptional regulator, sugar sensing transcriptional regulator
MSTRARNGTDHLIALGFSEIEADAYVFLLRESPATAYRVSQVTGRTAANTYKAMESLEARGAVFVEEADPRSYRAVPLTELLNNIEKIFHRHRSGASKLLAGLEKEQSDDRVYQLRDAGQVFERSMSILRAARHVALLDIFPEPLAELRSSIDDCIGRGVNVGLLVYEPIVIEGATVIVNYEANSVLARWKGRWLNLAADSAQQIHAILTPAGDEVIHATWSASPFLSHLYFSGLLGEMLSSAIRTLVRDGGSGNKIEKAVEDVVRLEHVNTPAFAALTSPPIRKARLI